MANPKKLTLADLLKQAAAAGIVVEGAPVVAGAQELPTRTWKRLAAPPPGRPANSKSTRPLTWFESHMRNGGTFHVNVPADLVAFVEAEARKK
jgi:hypothetical protein